MTHTITLTAPGLSELRPGHVLTLRDTYTSKEKMFTVVEVRGESVEIRRSTISERAVELARIALTKIRRAATRVEEVVWSESV